jgi:hypothetical protein
LKGFDPLIAENWYSISTYEAMQFKVRKKREVRGREGEGKEKGKGENTAGQILTPLPIPSPSLPFSLVFNFNKI